MVAVTEDHKDVSRTNTETERNILNLWVSFKRKPKVPLSQTFTERTFVFKIRKAKRLRLLLTVMFSSSYAKNKRTFY